MNHDSRTPKRANQDEGAGPSSKRPVVVDLCSDSQDHDEDHENKTVDNLPSSTKLASDQQESDFDLAMKLQADEFAAAGRPEPPRPAAFPLGDTAVGMTGITGDDSDRALAMRLQDEERAGSKSRLEILLSASTSARIPTPVAAVGPSTSSQAAKHSTSDFQDEKKVGSMSLLDILRTKSANAGRRVQTPLARAGPSAASQAASSSASGASSQKYAWRILNCPALGVASPGNVGAVSFEDIVAGRPKFVVISNFMINAEWLEQQWPALKHVERVVIFHGDSGTVMGLRGIFPRAEIHCMKPETLTFVDGRSAAGKTWKNEYGCHHSKFFLIGFEETLRVVVHTANLIACDWVQKSQGVWMQDFAPKSPRSATSSDFESVLRKYVSSLLVHRGGQVRQWKGLGAAFRSRAEETLADALGAFDFSNAKGHLVATIPGYHFGNTLDLYGSNRIAKILRGESSSNYRDDDEIYCQFSSFSSPKVVVEQLTKAFNVSGPHAPIRLVWPTAAEVRNSIEGYFGGGSMPSEHKNVSVASRDSLRRWQASTDVVDPFLVARRPVMPHIKTWSRVSASGEEVRWCLLSSSNLSGAAHGRSMKKGEVLHCMHWELGILVTPSSCGVASLLTTKGQAKVGDALVPLPFECPPRAYSKDDQPFMWREKYFIPDRFGRFGTLC